ncbi:alpha/beta hydrolase [Corynebacterium comes]|uniref:Tripeptidyl aminopeptidase n=1 Tax=Corynebacterium comes TaxID=2675218 RepID=A0A6B8W050_9CORY|nr:alpha/beta hydrolase [Corynebacterium comes]QGU04326.1 Tripeptidyl aminopeptidase precursor [Corynebacterium comes]
MRTLTRPLAATLAAVAMLGLAPATFASPAQPVTWEACPAQVTDQAAQCGRIDVPMYHSDPAGPKISVGFVRVPAASGTARGTLFGNPGGPGGDAYSYFGGEGLSWPAGIVNEWERVAVQPRGLPGSTPVACNDEVNARASVNPVDLYVRQGGLIREACESTTPGYTASLTTDNTVDDWEWVRNALGRDQISIMGLSYGTFLGSAYATRYPQHTDRVVLDSAMDPGLAWNGILGAQQAGYENSLHDFMAWTAERNDTYGLGDTPLAVYQAWSRKVVAESGTNPTVVPPPARVGDLPPGLESSQGVGVDVMNATNPFAVSSQGLSSQATTGGNQATSPTLGITRSLLPAPTRWDALARMINGTEPLPDFNAIAEQMSEEEADAFATAQLMQRLIMCNENQYPADPADIPDYAWTNFVTGDIFTAPNAFFTSGAACSGADPVAGLPAVDGSRLDTRPLLVQATGDPQTPYAHHTRLAGAMNAHVVTVHGNGHGHVGLGNAAVDEVVVEYLRTGRTDTTDVPGVNR